MSLILGRCIGAGEKFLATPSVGVRGKTHLHRNKRANWVSGKKVFIFQNSKKNFVFLRKSDRDVSRQEFRCRNEEEAQTEKNRLGSELN